MKTISQSRLIVIVAIYEHLYLGLYRDTGKKVGQGGQQEQKGTYYFRPTNLSQNGGHPRHFLGNIMGYASHSHINDCLFQSNIAFINN